MKLILGVTGSVAAKLTPKMVAMLLQAIQGIELKVVSTERGLYFFNRSDVSVPVLTDKDEWLEGGYLKNAPVLHIDLGDWADVLLIAPLTADTLSDMAHGKADKFLTSIVLAWPSEKPIFLAPAMNTRMWRNFITQENLNKFKYRDNIYVIEPIEGDLACGSRGVGAMARIEDIVAKVKDFKGHSRER